MLNLQKQEQTMAKAAGRFTFFKRTFINDYSIGDGKELCITKMHCTLITSLYNDFLEI